MRVERALGPLTRDTIDVGAVPGLEAAAFGTLVESDALIAVDRTMTWADGRGSHAERGIGQPPGTTWYFAEGATFGPFSLFYLLQNPGDAPAVVEATYLLATGVPLHKSYTVPAHSRLDVWVDHEGRQDPTLAALAAAEVSAVLRSVNGVPFVAERAMYFDRPGEPFAAGHASAGITAPATEWFLAEGATGPYFDEFLLVANPSSSVARLRFEYLLPDGGRVLKHHDVPAWRRYSVWVDQEDAALADTAVSVRITAIDGVPVIVERAMWWPGGADTWHEAHGSPGAVRTAQRWVMAEGEVGGPAATATFVLIANTSAVDGMARVTAMFEDGTPPVVTVIGLRAGSRTNVVPAVDLPQTAGRRFGLLVESVGDPLVDLVVERAMYSDAAGARWAAGTVALATPLP